ncbi:unnamed protein product [Rodentolepis nana]|uniref:Calcium channel flower n=1 Tax=Rodentolepis nana TaxID=102285 RepID=A0A0R3TB88_RODNA|nr:unnamed protein product [Rodentolepis nana]
MLADNAPSGNVFARYGARVLYGITGIMCCILGIVGAIGFSVICVFAGIFLFFIGLFILITEMPFCCAFIPQTEYITRVVTKIGPLPIAIVLALLGIIAMAMCPSFSMGFALCFLLASAFLRIREFILLRRARTQGTSGLNPESGFTTQASGYPGAGNTYPPVTPAYGAGDQFADRVAAGAARGAVQAAFMK